jgi:hypothetical protein
MNKQFKNTVIENALSKEDIDTIFEIVSQTTNKTFQENLCYHSWHIRLPEHIENKFLKYAEDIAGVKLRLLEYNFSRYENSEYNGKKYYPLLFPHTDEAFNGPRVTLDYQVRSNIKWSIIVDDWNSLKEYELNDNEILTFSGTHQIHWRPKKDFKDEDFLEAIFLHFEPVGAEPLTTSHINEMRSHAKMRWEEWKNTPGIYSNNSLPENDKYRYMAKENR